VTRFSGDISTLWARVVAAVAADRRSEARELCQRLLVQHPLAPQAADAIEYLVCGCLPGRGEEPR
jgi:hypothetical protein